MTANISSQSTQIIIGAENWSDLLESVTIGYDEYNVGSGLQPATGKLNLTFPSNYAGIPSNPEYRFNPQQWRRGQTLSIAVNGSYLPCSGQQLFILTPPQRPARVLNGIAKLSIEIGCKLALEYFPPEPNDDLANITPNTPKQRGVIITEVLTQLGITGVSVSIPEYAIAYPLPKLEGNWLEFCGKLADSAGYYLRCNTAGTIVAERILPSVSPSATYTIGVDESDWQPIGDVAESPVEKLIVAGVNYKVDVANSNTSITERAPLIQVDPDTTNSNRTQLIDSKETTTAITKINGWDSYYSQSKRIREPLIVIDPDTTNSNRTQLIDSLEEINDYFLDSNGNVFRTRLRKRQPLIVIDPDTTNSSRTQLIPSEDTTTTWMKTGDRRWTKTVDQRLPLIVIDPDTTNSNRTQLIDAPQSVDDADTIGAPQNIGFNQFGLQEEQLTSEVFAAQPATATTRERQKTISVPFATTQAQLTAYGQIFNRFLNGRAFGWRFATRLNTTLLPFNLVAVNDGTTGYLLYTDAMQWAISQTEALLVFNGIEDGVYATATPEDITRPVEFPIARLTMTLENNWSSEIFVFNFDVIRLENSWSSQLTI